jgi:hypothetical protein
MRKIGRKKRKGRKTRMGNVHHEGHEDPSAAGVATKFRNMSRKDAKAAKFGVCNESHSKGYHLFSLNLATLRLSGRNFRIRMSSAVESFAQAAQILNYSNTKVRKENQKVCSELRAPSCAWW